MRVLLHSVLLISVAACGSDALDVGPPASLAVVAAPPSSAEVGVAIADSLRVRVTDADGLPITGVTIVWNALAGMAQPASSVTGRNGVASTQWVLGTVPGVQRLHAAIRDHPQLTTEFIIESRPAAAASAEITPAIFMISRGGQVALTVRLRDRYGNVLPTTGAQWSTTNANVATVSPAGIVTGVGPGVADIRVVVEGQTASARVTVAVEAY